MTTPRKRSSNLKVVLEGIPINGVHSPESFSRATTTKRETGVNTRISEPSRSKTQQSAPSFVPRTTSPDNNNIGSPLPKPAILPRTGTVGAVPVADRKKPTEKLSTLRQGVAAPITERIIQQPIGGGFYSSSIVSTIESPTNQLDVGYLVNEALEISRQVDEHVYSQQSQYISPALPIQPGHRSTKRGRYAIQGAGGKFQPKIAALEKKEPSTIASLYETEQTRLVDSLILELKQSAAGVLLTDTDLKIRDVTKQIAESLGIPPEELDPELFSKEFEQLTATTAITSEKAPAAIEYEQEQPAVSAIPEETAGETSVLSSNEVGSALKLDRELSSIVKTMPDETGTTELSGQLSFPIEFSVSREAFSSEETELDIDDLNELGQLASLPGIVTLEDVLCIQGRQFKLGSLKELEKDDDKTVETKGRLEQLLESPSPQPQHVADDGRVHIHKLCFDDPKSEGLLPNELQQVAFEAHVNRRFNRHCDEESDDRPAWYKAALRDLRTNMTGNNQANRPAGVSFGDGSHSVPYVNVDDALHVPGLEDRPWPLDSQRVSFVEIKKNDQPDIIDGKALPILDPKIPKFPEYTAGPPLLGLTPLHARKQLFPNFESSANARIDDYLLVKPDSRFDPPKKSAFELFMMNLQNKASTILKYLVSKDDMNLLPRFRHRLPTKSSPPHRLQKQEADGLFIVTRRKVAPVEKADSTLAPPSVLSQSSARSAATPNAGKKRRSASFSRLYVFLANLGNNEPTVRIKQDYKQAIAEVEYHKTLCIQMAQQKKEAAEKEAADKAAEEARKLQQEMADQIGELATEQTVTDDEIEEGEEEESMDTTLLSQIELVEQTRKIMAPNEAELALWSVRRPGAVRKLPKGLKPRKLDSDKMEWVKARLAHAPRICRRSRRHSCPPGVTQQFKLHHTPFGPRSKSPDAFLDFEKYAKENGMKRADIPREWVRAIWEVWFDEVIPPLEAFTNKNNNLLSIQQQAVPQVSKENAAAALAESLAALLNTEKKAAEVVEEQAEVIITNEIFDLDLPPVTGTADDELEQEKMAIMAEEVERLTDLLERPLRMVTRAFTLTRRGAILRKLGKLVSALADLNAAVDLMPSFVDALWHRHFIFLVENKIPSAVNDLNLIVRIFRFHAGAYMSRAAIYTQREDILEAIDDYSMAIRSCPANAEAYFLRAKLYERKGEPLLAMEDYMRANQLMPNDTTALMCHAMHYVRTENYPVAIQDLTQILEREPANADMYILRGQCLVKQNRFELACADFSAAIYLKPNDPEPYFQRGCLLRKMYPDRALSDFSISLLLDSSITNVRSFLHRGILYFEMGFDHEAESDFEAILHLDRDHPAAHTNLGRIYLNKRLDYVRAVRRFTTAIRADPTYRQAYLCRAEAQTKLENYSEALRDFTKAIHLEPSDYAVYVHRGAVVLRTGNHSLAAFCIRQATEAQKEVGPGSAVYQKAFVQAFLKKFDKAIEILQSSLRNYFSSAQALIVLGKVYMKARNFQQAADCFKQAVDAMRPKREVVAAKYPEEVPEIYYLLGRCYVNLRKWSLALEAFNDAVKTKPDFAEAYYRRGVVRFALKHQKAIEDIHRALALDPKIFEAYMTRAVFFAQKKLWPLAIVNCNETIKLEPGCIRAFVYRGAFKFFNHNYKGAVEDLNEATRLDRSCVIALFNRACAYQMADCLKLALRDYSTILLVESQRGTSRITYQTYVNRGLLYFNRRDYANALADFRLAAKAKPQNADLVHALALCYHKQNLLKRSVLTYCQALSTHPYFDDGYIGRANALVDYNTMPARTYAMKEYMRRLMINPTMQAARINLAICLQMSGRLHQAYRQLTIVVALMERSNAAPLSVARAHELRGVVSLQAKSFDASFQDFSAAARVRPSAAILNNRAVCNLFMNFREAAIKDFREALRLDQRFSIGYFNLANMYMKDKRWEQAKDFFDRAILFGPMNETALTNRAVVLSRLGDLANAFNDLKAARKISPHAHHIAYNRAILHRMVNKREASLADIEEAIRFKPDDPELYRFRALIRGESGDSDGSMEDYAYAVDLGNYLKEIEKFRENDNNSKQLVPTTT